MNTLILSLVVLLMTVSVFGNLYLVYIISKVVLNESRINRKKRKDKKLKTK